MRAAVGIGSTRIRLNNRVRPVINSTGMFPFCSDNQAKSIPLLKKRPLPVISSAFTLSLLVIKGKKRAVLKGLNMLDRAFAIITSEETFETSRLLFWTPNHF